jgi:hypothetical protein
VTAPPNNETDARVRFVLLHIEPLTLKELKATHEADAG